MRETTGLQPESAPVAVSVTRERKPYVPRFVGVYVTDEDEVVPMVLQDDAPGFCTCTWWRHDPDDAAVATVTRKRAGPDSVLTVMGTVTDPVMPEWTLQW